MTRRARLVAVATTVFGGVAALICSTQPWLTVTLSDAGAESLTVAGADAVPVLSALSLAAIALGAALSVVGRVLRYAFAVLAIAIGAAILLLSTRIAVLSPPDAVAGTVSTATGLTGRQALDVLVGSITLTPWPVIAIVGGAAVLGAGVLAVATAHRWPSGGRRYRTDTAQRAAGSRPADAIDSWDDLSAGTDPTA